MDRRPRTLPLEFITNLIIKAGAVTKLTIQSGFLANPTTHEEVTSSGRQAEDILIPAFTAICRKLAQNS